MFKEKKLREKISELESVNEALKKDVAEKDKQIKKMRSDLKDALETVRSQTSADMLINALKACGIIRTDSVRDYAKKHEDLQMQLDSYRNMHQNYFGSSTHEACKGLFGGAQWRQPTTTKLSSQHAG